MFTRKQTLSILTAIVTAAVFAPAAIALINALNALNQVVK